MLMFKIFSKKIGLLGLILCSIGAFGQDADLGMNTSSFAWASAGQTLLFIDRGIFAINSDGSGLEQVSVSNIDAGIFGIATNPISGKIHINSSRGTFVFLPEYKN